MNALSSCPPDPEVLNADLYSEFRVTDPDPGQDLILNLDLALDPDQDPGQDLDLYQDLDLDLNLDLDLDH